MKEIEIKAKLVNREGIMERLKALDCVFGPMIKQEDIVYVKNVGSLKEFCANDVFLRIRVNDNKKVFFTLKKRDGNLEATEHEVEISSKGEMEQALFLMGYREAVQVNKTRVKTHFDGCEICIDEVEDLGSFIEMEKLTETGDVKTIQEEMFKFFESIGVKREDRVFLGYDILMLQKREQTI